MLEVTLVDKNTRGTQSIIDALSVCRKKNCTEQTIYDCLAAEPAPHLAALEHSWFEFHVKGLSIKARIQLLRHRLFTTMERSTRSINMSEARFVIPETSKDKFLYMMAFNNAQYFYGMAIKNGESIENAAYLLPLGTETEFYLSGNGRIWYEYLNKRLCKEHVQDESYRLAKLIYRELVKEAPYYKIAFPCRECDKC